LEAGSILNVSERRIREMVRQYKDSGVKGLISKKKGLLVTVMIKNELWNSNKLKKENISI